jgi:ubiquitin-like modifier-activating enzyme ATG7
LFTFEDCCAQDNFKAPLAAKRLAEIYPNVTTRGENMSIPMPGHSVGEDKEM